MAAALPIVVFLGWTLYRWHRRTLLLSRWAAGEAPDLKKFRLIHEPLFTAPAFRETARDFRRHRRVPAFDLDVKRTVEATLSAGGLFTPVAAERPVTPEYLFLIERFGAADHLVRLVDDALDRLEEEGVLLERRYFFRDPRLSQSRRDPVRPMPLAEIASRRAAYRLVVVGTAEGFFHPLTGRMEEWTAQFESWPRRTMLSALPLHHWSRKELALLESGFSLATASPRGFDALGTYIGLVEEGPSAELLEGGSSR
jgi:hypothetical protein